MLSCTLVNHLIITHVTSSTRVRGGRDRSTPAPGAGLSTHTAVCGGVLRLGGRSTACPPGTLEVRRACSAEGHHAHTHTSLVICIPLGESTGWS
jgi:hypothetical protein